MFSTNTTKRLVALAPILLFWLLIIATTLILLIEITPPKNTIAHFDKIVHVAIFILLSSVGCLAYKQHNMLIYYPLAAYGGLMELLQRAVTTTRHASLLDWLADLIGILLWLGILYFLKQRDVVKANH